MNDIVRARALCKRYGSFQALDALSMHVPEGAIYGFVGRNGAGKTTLIRLLCGLQAPTSGEYELYGIPYANARIHSARRRMGAMVESPAIYADLTAEENMRQQYRILGLPSFRGIPELLRLVGLEETGRKRARDFSQGMRQKLGIAMALSGDPDFIILDEPINGLDPQGIIELRALISDLNRRRQITFLISSHILGELSKLATHYGFIDRGHMCRELTADELEQSCKKATRVQVSDMHLLTRALDCRGLAYRIISDTQADIFAKMSFARLATELLPEGCEIYHCWEQDETLEEYFIRLVEEARHA